MQRKVSRHQAITAPTSPREAAELLGDLGDLRRSTRRSLGAPWYPLLIFGGLTVLSAALVAQVGIGALGAFWLLAGPCGLLAIRRHYRTRERRRGVTGDRRSWAVGIVLCCACGAAGVAGGQLGGATSGLLAPVWVAVAGYLAFGVLQRRVAPSVGVAAAATAGTATGLGGGAPWLVELVFGAGLMLTGVLLGLAGARR